MIRERKFDAVPGLPMLLLFLTTLVLLVLGVVRGASEGSPLMAVGSALGLLLTSSTLRRGCDGTEELRA